MSENIFTVYTEGDDLYGDMLEHIRHAEGSIALESYIFNPDETGKRFIDALVERAHSGVRIQLHLDTFGSAELLISHEDDRLREAGIDLKWFNPLRWNRFKRFNHRNHRKLLIVDNRVMWLGGFNIHDENSYSVLGEGRWRDTQVRIEGPLVLTGREYFDRLWQGQRRWRPEFNPGAESSLVSNHNWFQRHRLRRLLAHQFHMARNTVRLCTPYFMPDNFTRRHMILAARRGVQVQLLLPAISDRPVTQWVARASYAGLMKAGVRIFEYKPRVLHAKVIIIDECWCTIGSANLDYRMFFINFELNLVSSRRDLIGQLLMNYRDDILDSEEVFPRKWQQNKVLQMFYQLVGWVCQRIL